MIDFHCHLLPAIDDGATTIDESIAMAKSLSDFGYKAVCCTPHCIKGYYDLNPQKVRESTLMLQADLDNADIHLSLWPGMEYMLDEYFCENADDLLPLGETNLVLCEAPPQAHPESVQGGLRLIVDKGFVPLLAHPERTQYFYEMLSQRFAGDGSREKTEEQLPPEFESSKSPLSFVKRLFAPRATRHAPQTLEVGSPRALPDVCLFQANLGSFTGYYGPQVQSRAYALLKNDAYTCIASDLHDVASAKQVLLRDKFDFNPLLKKISDWDGRVSSAHLPENKDQGRQRELFQE
jgi:protein-tyrosine phosphatase